MVWLKFIVCAVIVVFAATKLSKLGDAISEKTRLTGNWVGLLLLATIASIDELIAGISSVAEEPNLAIGMAVGSNL